MVKNYRTYLLGGLILALLLSGCGTTRTGLIPQDSPLKHSEAEGISLTLKFLDDPTLIEKFGKKANPFLTLYHTLQFKRLMVFELSAENGRSSPVELTLNRLELQFAGKPAQPTNRFHLTNHWEYRDEQREVKNSDRNKKKRLIRQWVLPNSAVLAPGKGIRGYLVFMGNLPKYGQAGVHVPFFEPKGGMIHNFQLAYSF